MVAVVEIVMRLVVVLLRVVAWQVRPQAAQSRLGWK